MPNYKIKDYSYKRAKKLGVIIAPSKKTHKKIDVFHGVTGEYICSIGDDRYMDYPSYIESVGETEAKLHRKRYKIRHEKDRHKKNSAGYFADQILW